jgi:hypothetical protein
MAENNPYNKEALAAVGALFIVLLIFGIYVGLVFFYPWIIWLAYKWVAMAAFNAPFLDYWQIFVCFWVANLTLRVIRRIWGNK